MAKPFPTPDGQRVDTEPPVARLVRWTFDPAGNTDSFSEQSLDDHPSEFPRFDERYTGLPYRHGYFQAGAVTDASQGREARNGLGHIDHQSGAVNVWQPGVADHCAEPVFVPRGAGAARRRWFPVERELPRRAPVQ